MFNKHAQEESPTLSKRFRMSAQGKTSGFEFKPFTEGPLLRSSVIEPFHESGEPRRIAQPRQGEVAFKRGHLRAESRAQRLLKTAFYQGNQWDRILNSDEYTVLYYIFRTLSFLVDKAQGVKYKPDETQPRSQYLRHFASIYACIQLLICLLAGWWLVTWLLL